jgi:hypothetical protein
VLLRPLLKRLIELLFDRPQSAAGELAAAADALREAQARAHTGLVFPVAADAAASLADRYVSAELGQIDVRREGAQVVFDFGAWRSLVASRRDEHGAIAFVTVSPGVAGYEFRLEGPGARGAILLAGEGRAYRYTAQ